MKLSRGDTEDIRKMFEDMLRCIRNIDRIEKMKIRGRIRRELSHNLVWKKPTPDRILSRWENKLPDVFSLSPHGFRDDLKTLLAKKIKRYKIKEKKKSNSTA